MRRRIIYDLAKRTNTYEGFVGFPPTEVKFNPKKPTTYRIIQPEISDLISDIGALDIEIEKDKSKKIVQYKSEKIELDLEDTLSNSKILGLELQGKHGYTRIKSKEVQAHPWTKKNEATEEIAISISLKRHSTSEDTGIMRRRTYINGTTYEITISGHREKSDAMVGDIEKILEARYNGDTDPKSYQESEEKKRKRYRADLRLAEFEENNHKEE